MELCSSKGTETTSGLRSASVVAEQKSTGLLATHTDALKTRELQNFSLELLESKETGGEHLPQARTFVTQSFIVLQIHYEMFSECSYKIIKKNLVWDDGAVINVRY